MTNKVLVDLDALTTDQQDYLDGLVHDVASQVASNVNNNGEQIDYLLSNGWTLDQIREWIS